MVFSTLHQILDLVQKMQELRICFESTGLNFIGGSETGLRLTVILAELSAVMLPAAVGIRAQLQSLVVES